MLLGIPGDATYANYAEANRSFYRLTVLPMAGRTLAALSGLLDRSGRLKLWYDPDAIGALAPEREALWRRVNAARFLSDAEKREAVGYGGGSPEEKAGFRLDQPRVPRGRTGGGRWTDGGATVMSVQARPPRSRGDGMREIGGTWRRVSPREETEIAISQMTMNAAIARVREIEPNWQPTPQIYQTARGLIEANNANAREAQSRYEVLRDGGLAPGRYAVESQPARGPGRNWTAEEIRENNRIGRKYGCHTCGTMEPRTPSGNFVLDHQPATALNTRLREQILIPHCITCMSRQGGWVTHILMRRK